MTLKRIFVNRIGLLAGFCIAQSTCYGQKNVDGEDHLIPSVNVDSEEASYKQLLEEMLFVTQADFGRIIIMPSGIEGETSIALYSEKKKDGSVEFKITCTKAAENLGRATSDSNPKRSQHPAVQVSRFDAALPRKTMEMVHDGLKIQVEHRRPLNVNGPVYVDGTQIEFTLPQINSDNVVGLLGPATKGPNMSRLGKLADRLASYCKEPAKNRAESIIEIERIAKSLR